VLPPCCRPASHMGSTIELVDARAGAQAPHRAGVGVTTASLGAPAVEAQAVSLQASEAVADRCDPRVWALGGSSANRSLMGGLLALLRHTRSQVARPHPSPPVEPSGAWFGSCFSFKACSHSRRFSVWISRLRRRRWREQVRKITALLQTVSKSKQRAADSPHKHAEQCRG
jgi:hypothetical protein